MTLFNSDIIGTFTSSTIIDRKNDIKSFVVELNNLIYTLNLDKLFFSFNSSSDIKDVLKYTKELAKELHNSNIKLGGQYGCNQKYHNGDLIDLKNDSICKMDQILEEIKCCHKNGIEIDNIIMADDSEMEQLILQNCLKNYYPNIKCISLIPGLDKEDTENIFYSKEKGILGTTDCLIKYQESLKNKKISTYR